MSIKFPNIKHFLSLFLAAVMMVSLLAVNAHAASSNKITDYGDAYGHWAYHLRIEEKWQFVVIFELRYFHFASFLQFCSWPHTVHLPAPGCLRRFLPVGTLLRFLHGGLGLLFPGSMNSGGGYSIIEVQGHLGVDRIFSACYSLSKELAHITTV